MIKKSNFEKHLPNNYKVIKLSSGTPENPIDLIRITSNWFGVSFMNLPAYCGGVFMSSICIPSYSTNEDISKFITPIKDILQKFDTPMISYVSTKYQTSVNHALELWGFTKTTEFINPNTDSLCFHWILDLNKND